MPHSSLSLASLVGSRICHDLISPVGAINNGLELMAMGGPVDTPELTLISDAVHNANARIRFFRVAFGVASAAQMLGSPEIAGILAGVYAEGRHSAQWSATGDVPRAEVQAVYLAMLCVETALPVGGTITASHNDGRWSISGAGKRIAAEPALWSPLDEARAPDEVDPAQVHFALLPLCLQVLGRRPVIATGENDISISF